MKTTAICQAYNEGLLLDRAFKWIYPLVDKIIISEGRLTPFGDLPQHSTDDTREIIQKWAKKDKVTFVEAFEGRCTNREVAEGENKNNLLKLAEPEHGDLIVIWDVDEFYHPDAFNQITDRFRKYDWLEHTPVEEYQFAYNLNLYFNAEHNGRFMRYKDGAKFGSTNHFIYPDGRDTTKDYRHLITREKSRMCHLCWVKHPKLIREKVQSFNRPSFTNWFNGVYLNYPVLPEVAYVNNKYIAPHYGTGFAEGQHEKLQQFIGQLPDALQGLDVDWLDYIRENYRELVI